MAVQRMQEYLESNLETDFTLRDLSRVSLFSPWHSYRLFRRYLGLTPTEYVRRLRLSRSALRLKKENCRVIDAAVELGFGSVDGYTRAFFREFGVNPKEYAKNPVLGDGIAALLPIESLNSNMVITHCETYLFFKRFKCNRIYTINSFINLKCIFNGFSCATRLSVPYGYNIIAVVYHIHISFHHTIGCILF